MELSRRHGARHILQVLYQRPSTWEQLEIDGELVDLDTAVVQHFRNTASISGLRCPAKVEVVPETFSDRTGYLQIVFERIRRREQIPGIVFLDPDTGLEPAGSPGLQHVLESELTKIWRVLAKGDVMVLYQHQTNRAGIPWIESKKQQFEQALGIPQGSAKLAQATGIASDVAFFFAVKDGAVTLTAG
jgi:hypothetical protein